MLLESLCFARVPLGCGAACQGMWLLLSLIYKGVKVLGLVHYCFVVADVGAYFSISATQYWFPPLCCQKSACSTVYTENLLRFQVGFDLVHTVGICVEEFHVLEKLVDVCRCTSWFVPHFPDIYVIPKATELAHLGNTHSDFPLLPC